jgi:hypothetical protein
LLEELPQYIRHQEDKYGAEGLALKVLPSKILVHLGVTVFRDKVLEFLQHLLRQRLSTIQAVEASKVILTEEEARQVFLLE